MKKYPFQLFRFGLMLGASATVLAVAPGTPRAETLEDTVRAAMEKHPTVEAAQANLDALDQERRERVADFLPSVNVRGAAGRIYGDNATSRGLQVTRGSAYSNLWEGSVALTQPVFHGFETVNRYRAATERKEAARLDILDAQENLALRGVSAYLDLLRTQEVLARIEAYQSRLDDYIKRFGTLVSEGGGDEAQAGQARDIRAQLDNTKIAVEGFQAAAAAEYSEIAGRAPDGVLEPAVPDLSRIPETTDAAVDLAWQHHPQVLSSQLREEALKKEAAADRQFMYPDLDGELSYYERDQREEIGGEIVDAKAVMRLNWDFSLGGADIARMRKSAYRQAEGAAQARDARRQTEKLVRLAYNDLDTARAQFALQADRTKNTRSVYESTKTQFEGARADLLKLLESDNDLFSAELEEITTRYSVTAAEFRVLASLGILRESLLAAPVEYASYNAEPVSATSGQESPIEASALLRESDKTGGSFGGGVPDGQAEVAKTAGIDADTDTDTDTDTGAGADENITGDGAGRAQGNAPLSESLIEAPAVNDEGILNDGTRAE